MTQRNPFVVLLLAFITFGIYGLVWFVKTKNEMNEKFNAGIPTAWLLIVPIANYYWMWKWSAGVEKSTGFSAGGMFVLMLFVGWVGMPLAQAQFNRVQPATALPVARAFG